MTYTAPGQNFLKTRLGTDSSILSGELSDIDDALDSAGVKYIDLTASVGTTSALATTGVDVADGTGGTTYCVFVAPVALTIVGMVTYLTEAYVKDTDDAKIELKTEASTPVTKATYTLPAAGRAAKTTVTTAPASASMDAGDALDLVITATAASSGTGHAKVFLKYTID